jgi:hypothetical protein
VVKSQFGPSASRRTVVIGLAALVVLAGVALLIRGGDGRTEFAHEGRNAFTLRYPPSMRRVATQPGEIVRFEARRGALTVSLAIRTADYPRRRFFELPIVASLHGDELRARLPELELRDEGRTRLSRQPAYELNYRFGPPGRRSSGRDVLVFGDESGLRDGAILSTRTAKPGRPLDEGDRDLIKAVRRAAHSLLFESAPR